MRLVDRGLIYDASGRAPEQRIAAFVGLCRLRSGTILCSYQRGPRKHAVTSTVGICRSRDGGRTWQELPFEFNSLRGGIPGSLSSGEMVEIEPGRLLLISTWFDRSDPDRPLFDPDTEGLLHSRQLQCVSTDEGDSWSDWTEIATPGLSGCAATGPLLRGFDGRVAYPFESFKEFDDPRPARHGAWLLVSHDGGRTFPDLQLVAQDPQHACYYWDQRLCPGRSPDEYYALFWTHDRAAQRDLTVHAARGTWPAPPGAAPPVIHDTRIPGQIAAPALLPDGRLLAFVVDRGQPCTLKLWQSHDGGRTWPPDEALVVYTHDERALLATQADRVDFAEYWEDMAKWSFGHPAIRPLDDGHVLLAWYAGNPDALSVHWARVATG